MGEAISKMFFPYVNQPQHVNAPGKTSPDSPDRVYSEKTTTDARFLHLFVVDTRCTNIAQRIHVQH